MIFNTVNFACKLKGTHWVLKPGGYSVNGIGEHEISQKSREVGGREGN